MTNFDKKIIKELSIRLKEGYSIDVKLIGKYINTQPSYSTALPDWTSLELRFSHTCDEVIGTIIEINNINHIDLMSIVGLFDNICIVSKNLSKASTEIKEAEKKILEILKENDK